MNETAQKNLEILKKTITKQFGKGAVTSLSERPLFDETRVLHTGSISLDTALGIGGYPKGRMVEIYGAESTGKSTLALEAIAESQANGGSCAYIDTEHALDLLYSKSLGINVDDLLLSQPTYGEEALEIINIMTKSSMIDLIILDSVAALIPRAELEGESGDSHVGLQARLMSQAMRKLAGSLNNSNTTILFINQTRSNIVSYGSPITTSGGNALKFYASQRIQLSRISIEGDKENPSGIKLKAKVVKNKLAPPFRQTELGIRFGQGIDRVGEVLDLSLIDGLIEKSGSWYKFEGESVGQGRENAAQWLEENPEIMKKLKQEILESRGME